ncbi:MAG: cell division FtsA domain-containing protein [Bacteroidaceae bacterium]
MAKKKIIIGIALNSSMIWGGAAIREYDDTLKVIAAVSEPNERSVRKGIIYNKDSMVQNLTNIINILEEKIGKKIVSAYVTMGGQSMCSQVNKISKDITGNDRVTQELVDEMYEENLNKDYSNAHIVDVITQGFMINNVKELNPVGIDAEHIIGQYLNIIIREGNYSNVGQVMDQVELPMLKLKPLPVVIGDIILNDNDRRSGVVLVDMGSQTTSVSIYQDGLLQALYVLPMGGDNIVFDIMNERIDYDEVEELKHNKIQLTLDDNRKKEDKDILIDNGERTIKQSLLNFIAKARVEEIVENVWALIQRHDYRGLMKGLIITGGVSKMNGIQSIFESRTRFTQIQVRNVPTIKMQVPEDLMETQVGNGHFNALLAILNSGNENCCQEQQYVPKVPELFPNGEIPLVLPSNKATETTNETIGKDSENEQNPQERGTKREGLHTTKTPIIKEPTTKDSKKKNTFAQDLFKRLEKLGKAITNDDDE